PISTLHAVLSSAPGSVNGERDPSALTRRFPDCEIFTPLSSRLLSTSPPSLRKDPLPKTSWNKVDSSRPTYMKSLLSLTVVFLPFPLKLPAKQVNKSFCSGQMFVNGFPQS